MLRGAPPRAEEMVGTAVLRIVVSRDSIKKATATSHGKRRLEASEGSGEDGGAIGGPAWFILRHCGELLCDASIGVNVTYTLRCIRGFHSLLAGTRALIDSASRANKKTPPPRASFFDGFEEIA